MARAEQTSLEGYMLAYGVRANFADYEPGVISLGDTTFDLKGALEEGDGSVVVADDGTPYSNLLVAALEAQPALKRVAVRTAAEDARKAASDSAREAYENKNLKELQDEAARSHLEVPKSTPKAELVDALVAHADANWTPEGADREV